LEISAISLSGNKMTKGDKIRLGIMFGFLALVANVWIEAIMLIQMAYSG
jgi:hypothetical protein